MGDKIILRGDTSLKGAKESEKFFLPQNSDLVPIKANQTALASMITKIPSGPLIRRLRDEGIRRREFSSRVELEGEIYLTIPGSDTSYFARKAEVFWETPIEIDVLEIFDEKKEEVTVGRLDFHSRRPSPVVAIKDPNIMLYSDSKKIEITQALGVPRFYVKNCKIKYIEQNESFR